MPYPQILYKRKTMKIYAASPAVILMFVLFIHYYKL